MPDEEEKGLHLKGHSIPLGDHRRAAHYCKLSCESVEATMGSSSIELGRELHKLALLLFQR